MNVNAHSSSRSINFSKEIIKELLKPTEVYINTDFIDYAILTVSHYIASRINAKNNTDGREFKINKSEAPNIPTGQGYTIAWPSGADIYYSSQGSMLQQWVAIAHELGHLVLHYNINHKSNVFDYDNAGNNVNLIYETQASYFAKQLLSHNIEQYRSHGVGEAKRYKISDIDDAILSIYPYYNETSLIETYLH
jgi:hypothetical protein